jgi:hypothetical protein
MKIRLHTNYAHPTWGSGEPGSVLDLPEADAEPLLTAGYAERVEPPPRQVFESAAMPPPIKGRGSLR